MASHGTKTAIGAASTLVAAGTAEFMSAQAATQINDAASQTLPQSDLGGQTTISHQDMTNFLNHITPTTWAEAIGAGVLTLGAVFIGAPYTIVQGFKAVFGKGDHKKPASSEHGSHEPAHNATAVPVARGQALHSMQAQTDVMSGHIASASSQVAEGVGAHQSAEHKAPQREITGNFIPR